jgi:hypothetical protein
MLRSQRTAYLKEEGTLSVDAREGQNDESLEKARNTTEKNYDIHKPRSTFVLIALFSDFSLFRRSVFSRLSRSPFL